MDVDPITLKEKSIKPDPATSEEDDKDTTTKLSSVEEKVDIKPSTSEEEMETTPPVGMCLCVLACLSLVNTLHVLFYIGALRSSHHLCTFAFLNPN